MPQSPILNGYIHIMCVLIMDLRVNSGISARSLVSDLGPKDKSSNSHRAAQITMLSVNKHKS